MADQEEVSGCPGGASVPIERAKPMNRLGHGLVDHADPGRDQPIAQAKLVKMLGFSRDPLADRRLRRLDQRHLERQGPGGSNTFRPGPRLAPRSTRTVRLRERRRLRQRIPDRPAAVRPGPRRPAWRSSRSPCSPPARRSPSTGAPDEPAGQRRPPRPARLAPRSRFE